ncbi:MAG: MerR family transcriptional regulator [Fibrobacterales bacterium]
MYNQHDEFLDPSEFGVEDIKVSIGEAAKIIGVAAHTIRYWEKEFAFFLSSNRTNGRQRRYDENALDKLKKVYAMLKRDGYSIAGAKRALYFEMKNGKSAVAVTPEQSVSNSEGEIADRIAAMIKNELMSKLLVAER